MKLVFCHIPKTGGRTVYDLLRANYRRPRYIKIADCPRAYEIIQSTAHDVYFGPFGYKRVPGCVYVTLMRHPVERVWSYYRMLNQDEREHPPEDKARATGSLFDFATCGWKRLENAACGMLCGRTQDNEGEMGEEQYRQALQALEEIEFVGLTSDIEGLAARLGLTGPVPHLNKTKPLGYTEDADYAIRRRNRYDMLLWRHARCAL